MFRHRSARDVRFRDRIILAALCAGGFGAVLLLANWWFRAEHVANLPLYVLLSLVFWYGMSRIVLGWINLLALRKDPHVPAPQGLRVAVFTTSSPGEPLSMFEVTLAACKRITYPHTTYLLDDTRDARFRECAERHGATWLELVGIPGAKAGKINTALERTTEDIILVLDPDHIPFPNIFDRVLGYFNDERVGFVQIVQAYYNQTRSFVARAAAEQTYTFYGPTQMGLFGHGAAVAIGANCTFRRTALESIGGHGIGLAEDLITSIRLHAAGWRSVYVPEVLARGLVPEDLGSFYKQQLKWARGVYEVVFAEFPRLFSKLDMWQRLAYGAIGTYYLYGVTMLGYLVLPYLYLWTGTQPAAMPFAEFAIAGAPVALFGIIIYFYAQRWLAHPETEFGLHWRGMALKIACWPVFLVGTVLAVARAEIPYIPTAKEGQRGEFIKLAWPHLVVIGTFVITVIHTLYVRGYRAPEESLSLTSEAVWAMIGFASIAVVLLFGGIYAAWRARTVRPGTAWDGINATS
ncbi:MAG TPA: glycosyltransferase [Longimicrobiales bacterium]|nr:glycosyltransferase [Longimicrobiales bacterium]